MRIWRYKRGFGDEAMFLQLIELNGKAKITLLYTPKVPRNKFIYRMFLSESTSSNAAAGEVFVVVCLRVSTFLLVFQQRGCISLVKGTMHEFYWHIQLSKMHLLFH